jgi:hypothetical protein
MNIKRQKNKTGARTGNPRFFNHSDESLSARGGRRSYGRCGSLYASKITGSRKLKRRSESGDAVCSGLGSGIGFYIA